MDNTISMIAGAILLAIISLVSGHMSRGACMDATGAPDCELKWVPSEAEPRR